MYHVRWGINSDIESIKDIEETVYGPYENLSKKEIRKLKNLKNVIILVVDGGMNRGILGYLIYKINKNNIEILRMAVAPEYQSQGVGRAMMQKILEKIKPERNEILFNVDDNFTVGHLFLKNFNFNCYDILWGNNGERDLYLFRYVLPEPSKCGGK